MGGLIVSIVYLAIMIAMIAGFWKVFAKAGEPGWACLVPIYNLFIMLKFIGKPWWWIIVACIPIIGFIAFIIISIDVAKVFGKGAGFGIGLLLLPFVFYPILGFGDAEYTAPPSVE